MPFSAFGILYLPSVLVVRGDPAATARNLMASEWLLRSAVVAHLVAETLPVWVALTVYRLLKPGTLT